ncbi:MAG: hypothetical protein NZ811_07665 [Gammaproteobacteria bacterium]|nr:hypothetical protein [Gammaproteobacteria bacterium]
MKLKALLTLSLVLAGFTHSAFGFYGVDLGKLEVVEDSQDKDYNEGQYRVNQNIKLKPVGLGGIYPGNFNIQSTNPFWKNTNTINPNPFDGIFNTINSNIRDNNNNNNNNDLGIRYQRDMDGNKILGISKDTLDGGIQNNRIDAIHTNVRELDLNQEDNPTAKRPVTQLQFVNGEWVEASVISFSRGEVIVSDIIDPEEGTTAVSSHCGPGNNVCIIQGESCSYSNPPNIYACVCVGVYWNCKKQK